MSRVMQLANDTYKSVATLWSPSKVRIEAPKGRTAVPKLELDGTQASHRSRKRKAQDVLALARKARKSNEAVKALEEDFCANSSRACKTSMRQTLLKILTEAGKDPKAPPTVDAIKTVAGVLKQANYRAAPNYLGELKLLYIESGQAWSEMLERSLQLCKRSAMRAVGPKKKAKEVPTDEKGKWLVPCPNKRRPAIVPLARELFEFGVIWMLREIEIGLLTKDHVKLDLTQKRVILTIPVSKMDQQGASLSRMLQCLCDGPTCSTGCPVRITARLFAKMESEGHHYASVTNKGKRASKAQLVREWKKLFGTAVSGHSTRRTGALRYIRHGWAIPQVAYLGRWKSAVIYEYAAEALESLPVNSNQAFLADLYGTKGDAQGKWTPDQIHRRVDEIREYLMGELALAWQHQDRALKAMDFEIEAMKARADANGERLPPYVQALGSRVIHDNWDMSSCSPPLAWRTKCGWQYNKSDFIFNTTGTGGERCKKCLELARRK